MDALQRVTLYFYDASGNLTGRADGAQSQIGSQPESGPTQCGGTGMGNGADDDSNPNDDAVADDGCPNTTYLPDDLNRLAKIEHWGATLRRDVVDYTYDSVSNRLTMVETPYDALGDPLTPQITTTRYRYDALNRVDCFGLITIPAPPNPCPSGDTGYAYDDDPLTGSPLNSDYPGQRTRITYPDGKIVDYTYWQDGRMKRVTDWLGKATDYQYDDARRLFTVTYPSTPAVVGNLKYYYDLANRVTALIHTSSFAQESLTYPYDPAGNRKSLSRCSSSVACVPQDNPTVESYQYDPLYRLKRVDYPDLTFRQYTYDALGNRLLLDANGTTTTYGYNGANQLTQIGTTALVYDNGNLTSRLAQGYSYDGENRLTKILQSGFDPHPANACQDFNGTGTISISDVLELKPVFGTAVPPTSAWYDIVPTTPTSSINVSDVLATGTSVQRCPSSNKRP